VVLGRIVVVDSGGKRRRRVVGGGGEKMLRFAGSMWVGMVVVAVMRRRSDVVGTVKDFCRRGSHKARGLGNGRTFCVARILKCCSAPAVF